MFWKREASQGVPRQLRFQPLIIRNSPFNPPNSLWNRCLASPPSSRFLRTSFASSAAARNSGWLSMSLEVKAALNARQWIGIRHRTDYKSEIRQVERPAESGEASARTHPGI